MNQTRPTEEEIFKIAREIPAPQAQMAYLKQACGEDPALYERVVALLSVAEEEQSFLDLKQAYRDVWEGRRWVGGSAQEWTCAV